MKDPDVELEITRDDKGRVTKVDYKVNNEGKDGKRALEGLQVMTVAVEAIFASEGPEDHSTYAPVDVFSGS